MADKKIEIIRESGTHYTVKLPVDDHELVFQVDKKDFTISIPYFEYMQVYSIVKLIVQLLRANRDDPFINEFLSLLHQPVNEEELRNLKIVYREFSD